LGEGHGPFPHVLEEDPVRVVGALEGKDLVPRWSRDDDRVHLASVDGRKHLLGFLEPCGELRDPAAQGRCSGLPPLAVLDVLPTFTSVIYALFLTLILISRPMMTLPVSDMSPMSLRIGRGSFLISVGAAMICSPFRKGRLPIDVDHVEVYRPARCSSQIFLRFEMARPSWGVIPAT